MPNSRPDNPAARSQRYMDGVLAGAVPAGPEVRLAVQRHLKDCEAAATDDFPYYFSPEVGELAAEFIELLPHTKGRWAARAERLRLSDWQCFLVVTLFGWLRKRDHLRRFRSVYWEIARKNGKSILSAAIGLYMLLADKEFGAEVYSGATTEKQAWEVFRPAKQMMERTPELQEAFGAQPCAKALVVLAKGSKFEPVIGSPGDGPSPSCAIVDEYHEHPTSILHDSMETGMGAREQPLLLIITTAGFNTASPCHEKHDEVVRVLNGLERNDQLFGVIFGLDKEDDWADPKSLAKANPNMGISVDEEFLLAQQRNALANPIQQNKFKTKHLNIWCSVKQAWMPSDLWHLSADKGLVEDELRGVEGVQCWQAFDLASKTDLCSLQTLYRKILNNKPHYYLFGRYWLPEESVNEDGPNHAHYLKWVRTGLLTQTEGATVDFDSIEADLIAAAQAANPEEVIYDPFNATHVAQKLQEAGIKQVVEFTQAPHNFAVPMDDLLAAVKDGRFHHDDNEMTSWCMTNVVARPTKKGLFAPMKSKPHLKIDGAVAAVMAFARASATDKKRVPEYQMLVL